MNPATTKEIDKLFSEWDKPGSPGFSLAIVSHGRIVYKQGYGMASLEHGVRISTKSVFDIGSTSKQFVAFCLAILEKKRKLSLEDSVQKYIPELRKYKYPVTIRHLIHHTGGVRDYLTLMELAGMRFENEYPDEEIIGLIARQKELNFKPGEEFLYSNSGYLLLGEIVKRVSGKSLRDFADKNIFSPLGMRNTHFHDDFTEIIKNKAMGYSTAGGMFKVDSSLFDVVGDGGVNTTVEDLFLWDQNFYRNRLAGGGQGLIKTIMTPGTLNSGRVLNYAYGLFVNDYRGVKMVSHGGAWVGYRSELIRLPQKSLSVICLSNLAQTAPTRLAKQVVDICLNKDLTGLATSPEHGVKHKVGMPAGEMKNKTGFYYNNESESFLEISIKSKKMFLKDDESTYPLAPVGPCCYAVPSGSREIRFVKSSAKTLHIAMKKQNVRSGIYQKISPQTIPADKLRALSGEYYCDELGVAYKVTMAEGGLCLVRNSGKKERLRSVCGSLFAGEQISVKFIPGTDRIMDCFYLNAGRVTNLCFKRASPE